MAACAGRMCIPQAQAFSRVGPLVMLIIGKILAIKYDFSKKNHSQYKWLHHSYLIQTDGIQNVKPTESNSGNSINRILFPFMAGCYHIQT